MGDVLITRRGGSGGGATKNVLAIWNGDADATITATLGSKVLTATTDASGYAYFTNLDAGTWTLQATKTGRYVGAKTITITATQTAYYIKYPFRTYVYDGSLNSGGETGANVCADFSGGWTGSGGGGVMSYNATNVNRLGDSAYIHHLYNVTPIDLTPFNTLYIKCRAQRSPIKGGIIMPSSLDWRTYASTSSTSTETLSVDVTQFEGVTGRVAFGDATYVDLTIYSAWFE